jgi:polysaccharide deacetylase family protein (PEP-CTERM system associated)
MMVDQSVGTGIGRSKQTSAGALTVDLEDWRCALHPDPKASYLNRPKPNEEYIRESTRKLINELDESGSRATFFVLGEVARAVPEVVAEISRRGHEIASHSPVHIPPRMVPRTKLLKMIQEDVAMLEHISGRKPIGFRAPYFAVRKDEGWLFEMLAKCGFQYDSSIVPTRTPYWGIPFAPKTAYYPDFEDLSKPASSGPLLEFPPSVWPSWRHLPGLPIAGGFYLRAWPQRLLSHMMRSNIRAGIPLVVYIHPGNLETEKERIKDPTLRDRISQYVAAERGPSSFRSLLRQFKFDTLANTFSERLNTPAFGESWSDKHQNAYNR